MCDYSLERYAQTAMEMKKMAALVARATPPAPRIVALPSANHRPPLQLSEPPPLPLPDLRKPSLNAAPALMKSGGYSFDCTLIFVAIIIEAIVSTASDSARFFLRIASGNAASCARCRPNRRRFSLRTGCRAPQQRRHP